MVGIFSTCIQKEDISFLQSMNKSVIMKHLACNGGNCGECETSTGTLGGNLQNRRSNLRLVHAGTYAPISLQMHHGTYVHGILDNGNFFRGLMDAHIHDGLDHHLIGMDGLHVRQYAQKIHQTEVMVSPVRRQEADMTALVHGLAKIFLKGRYGQGLIDAHQLGIIGQRRHGAGPDNVVDG